MLTIGDLRNFLEEFDETYNNCPVVMLQQPRWPFVYSIDSRIVEAEEILRENYWGAIENDEVSTDEDGIEMSQDEYVKLELPKMFMDIVWKYSEEPEDERPKTVFYLLENNQLRYANGPESRALGE